MHDRSRRSSLYGSLNLGRRCVNPITLTTLFMTTSSIKPLSRLTPHPINFTPDNGLPMVRKEQHLTEFASITRRSEDFCFTNIQMKDQSWACRSNDNKGFSHFLRILYDNPIIKIPSMKKEVAVVSDLIDQRV
ncbi:hypothetical protein QL285_012929 [Trifolium repens]|nr:hypothetical protein QL285_012929 [Trifolium repens]